MVIVWGIVGKFISLQRNGEKSHAFAYGNGGMSSKIHLKKEYRNEHEIYWRIFS